MKNLFLFSMLGLLMLFSCQSDPKNNAAANTQASTPVTTPAPVATAPKSDLTEKRVTADEVPSLPGEDMGAKKAKQLEEMPTDKTGTKPRDITEIIPQKKKTEMDNSTSDLDRRIAEEKEKLVNEATKIEEESRKKAAEKAREMKESADKKAEKAKNTIREKTDKVKETIKEATFSHQAFDDLLRKHVNSAGKVNYNGFKGDHTKLQAYLKQLEGQSVESSWSKDKKLAYWINAYNAYTIDMVVRNYPLKSIKDLEGGKPWDKSFINLNGKTLSLNDIENNIIRPTFKDARIHFAVNCAAKSCPPLMNKAWTEGNLQGELDKRTKAFINNNSYNTISGGSAKVSKIFEWYAEDFGNLSDYLSRYSDVTGNTQISYNEYDWSLNN